MILSIHFCKKKNQEKTWILADFWILAGTLVLQSEFPGLVLIFSISKRRTNFLFSKFASSFLQI